MLRRSSARPNRTAASRQVATTYIYRDAQGLPVYRLVRYVPKDFKFQKPNGNPWTAQRRPPLLYRLPELLAADPTLPVFVVEGEKDVDRLSAAGLVATCNDNGGGKGKWRLAHARPLRCRSVVILPDNDATGQEHAEDAARRLQGIARELRVVTLPKLPLKGDVSDWLDQGGTATDLTALCAAAPLWTPRLENPKILLDREGLATAAYHREKIYAHSLMLLDLGERLPPARLLAGYLGVTERRLRQLVAGLRERAFVSILGRGRSRKLTVNTYQLS